MAVSDTSGPAASASVALRYDVPVVADDWILPEVPVPESVPHRYIVELVAALLSAWAARTGRDAFVARNLAFRWDEARPGIGVDPDVCLLEPSPPDAEHLQSMPFAVADERGSRARGEGSRTRGKRGRAAARRRARGGAGSREALNQPPNTHGNAGAAAGVTGSAACTSVPGRASCHAATPTSV